jgi:16S rRNA (cytosine1402-N4)-methyltransferase
LGLSSWQLDSAERGFSHSREGPLDMRYDRSQEGTAGHILARASARELTDIFTRYGEEPRARRVAEAIVRRRTFAPVRTTTDLSDVVRSVVPGRNQGDALARTFQALRIATNGELDRLERFLEAVPSVLGVGGRVVVISFHSLEDRRVKRALGRGERAGIWRVLTPKPVRPAAEELAANPRSRSARLRAAEKLLVTGLARAEGGGA